MVSFSNSITSSKGGNSVVMFKVNQVYGDNCKSWILVSQNSIDKGKFASLPWAFDELSVPYIGLMIQEAVFIFFTFLCVSIGYLLELYW